MKQYIIVDDSFKMGQHLIALAKELVSNNKSIKIVSEAEFKGLAISPTYKKPYNAKVQKTFREKESYDMGSIDDFMESI